MHNIQHNQFSGMFTRTRLRNRRPHKGLSVFGLQTLIIRAAFTATQLGQIKIDGIGSACADQQLSLFPSVTTQQIANFCLQSINCTILLKCFLCFSVQSSGTVNKEPVRSLPPQPSVTMAAANQYCSRCLRVAWTTAKACYRRTPKW